MSTPTSSLKGKIPSLLQRLERESKKKLLKANTNPFIIYFYKILLFDILRPLEYILLNPDIMLLSFTLICVDNIEIWIRFTRKAVQCLSTILRKIIECSSGLQSLISRKLSDWNNEIDVHLLLSSNQNTLKMSCLKLLSFALSVLRALNYLHLYARIPVLIAMNKNNAFTIKMQQFDICLLQTKSQYLGRKNDALSRHVVMLEQMKNTRYNVVLLKILKKCLRKSLPTELIYLLHEFSHMHLTNDRIELRQRTKSNTVLMRVSKMNHLWIRRRYNLVNMCRNVDVFEKGCWLILYCWFRLQAFVLMFVRKMRDCVCEKCRISKQMFRVIGTQLIVLFVFYLLMKRSFF